MAHKTATRFERGKPDAPRRAAKGEGLRGVVRKAKAIFGRPAAADATATSAATVLVPSADAELARVRASWEAFAKHDPLWAIVSTPDKRGNRWDMDEFFSTGAVEVRHVMALLQRLNLVVARDRALDFGCGVGRLTQALATEFGHVDGVDISTRMIEQARALNRHGDRVGYHLGGSDTLPFADAAYDFVLSRIVLQHVPVALQVRYVSEFIRVLRPGGLAVFQATARLIDGTGTQFRSDVDTPEGRYTIDMNTFPREDVERAVRAAGGTLLHAVPDQSAGEKFESFVYVVAR